MRRLNNKGFAISTLLYGLMIMSLLVVIALLANLGTNRSNTVNFVDKIEDELNRLSVADTEGDYVGGDIDDNGREYIAPASGWYKIELWGAAGGGSGTAGGRGSYVSGIMYLVENDHLYFYVGEQGSKAAAFNGGGAGSDSDPRYFAGGGATDVRLISGTWNDESSLESRIMVAAGGGGAGSSTVGGMGGTLLGGDGNTSNASDPKKAYGGAQYAGGKHGEGSHSSGTSGTFGTGGTGGQYLSGGGGGYYGGGASGVATKFAGSGAGGSSFIMGFAGVRTRADGTVKSETIKTFNIHRGDYNSEGELVTESYTPVIYNGLMVPGVNDGAGKFKITKVSDNDSANPPRKGSNQKLNQVQYIKDCIDGSNNSTAGQWIEIQAIQNGVNLAKDKSVIVSGGTGKDLTYITDGNADDYTKYAEVTGSGTKCVTIDLGSPQNLDEIAVWHQSRNQGKNWNFKNHTLSVSSDNSTWKEIKAKSSDTSATGILGEMETSYGVRYNTFHADALGEIPEGDYYLFNANSDKQILTSYEESGTVVGRMDFFTGETNQIWHVYKQADASGNTYYRIVNRSNNLALEVSDGSADTGVLIDLYDNNINNTSQNWNIVPLGNGYYTIVSQSGVRMGYNTSSSIAETQAVTQEKAQRWKFVLAGY